MKKLALILAMLLLIATGCVTTSQSPKSVSKSYDGIWEGYTDTFEGRFHIKMNIIDGIITGDFEGSGFSGYIDGNDTFVMKPFTVQGTQLYLDVSSMSPKRMEGTINGIEARPTWFVDKK